MITATMINVVGLSEWFAGLSPATTYRSRFVALQYA